MPLLLPAPEVQFIDADGNPYAGGTVTTYIPGTDTYKDTWQDEAGDVLNTNPIVLDSAGRALIFGDGDYRFVLEDALGNLIYDQWTSSVVSDAMQPVVRAPTLADAQGLLGITSEDDINALIAAETTARQVGEAALWTGIGGEQYRATTAENNLQSQIDALSGGSPPTVKAGSATTDLTGGATITFTTPFPSGTHVVAVAIATTYGTSIPAMTCSATTTTLLVYSGIYSGGSVIDGFGGIPFNWIATAGTQ